MSLDVYLELAGASAPAGSSIFVRENGQTREITRAEWDEKFPGREPIVALSDTGEDVYSDNITHNLGNMAGHAGALYEALWRPEELGITTAAQLVEPLRAGLAQLRGDPEKFKMFNPSNGWGDYAGLVGFVERYLAACEQYPQATVRVSR